MNAIITNCQLFEQYWTADVSERAKKIVVENESLRNEIIHVHQTSPDAMFDMKEHIDTCFTSIAKKFTHRKPNHFDAKSVYDFSVVDICSIPNKNEGVVKYLLQDGRKTMAHIFDKCCALVRKKVVCHQCFELNDWFNPKEDQQAAIIIIDRVRGSKKYNRVEMYLIRETLTKAIHPLRSKAAFLQQRLLKCNNIAIGEMKLPHKKIKVEIVLRSLFIKHPIPAIPIWQFLIR